MRVGNKLNSEMNVGDFLTEKLQRKLIWLPIFPLARDIVFCGMFIIFQAKDRRTIKMFAA